MLDWRMLAAAVALSLLAQAGAERVGAQPGGAGAPGVAPYVRFGAHPYRSALEALAGLEMCGTRTEVAELPILTAKFHAIEALAVSRGLGSTLEQIRRDYLALLAISSRAPCVRGSRPALGPARQAIDAFRIWVADEPAQ